MILKYSIGLDVSSKKIDASICTIYQDQSVKYKSSCTISNSNAGFKKLSQWIDKWTKDSSVPVVVCMEATGVYHENCAYYLSDHSYVMSIILPNKAKKYLQSLGLKSKNDKIDAKGLARMGAEQKLTPWVKPAASYALLRSLTRQYQSIQESITAEKNKLHAEELSAISSKEVVKQIKGLIKFLGKQKKEIELAISKCVNADPEIKSKMGNVCKVKGLSMLSVATVIAETSGFELFSNYKQVVSYAGYDVVENQSGSHQGKTKISKKGNSRIRRVLHMPSLTAIGSEGTKFRELYLRIYGRTGIKMKGVVAVQKKLLLTIYYLWKRNEPYNAVVLQPYLDPVSLKIEKEISHIKDMAKQGGHSVKYLKNVPSEATKLKKNKELLVF
ncbi:MAG: IS110 family transposase [Bacteroidales bacterium]|jgi:transposase|nr:IS110 family transposase [Bacteroidales bacterium]